MLDEAAAVGLAVKHWAAQPPSAVAAHAATVAKAIDQLAACADALADGDLQLLVADAGPHPLCVADSLLTVAGHARVDGAAPAAVAALRCIKCLLQRGATPPGADAAPPPASPSGATTTAKIPATGFDPSGEHAPAQQQTPLVNGNLFAPWGTRIVPLVTAPAPEVQAAAAELVFLAAHVCPHALLPPDALRPLVGAIGGDPATPTAMALFFLLGAAFRLATATAPRHHAAALLASAGLHSALAAALVDAAAFTAHAGSAEAVAQHPWQPTARGLALHTLAALVDASPAVVTRFVGNAAFRSTVLGPALRSEWCEPLEGALLLAAAAAPHVPAAAWASLLAQHDAAGAAHAAMGSSSIRVAAAGARLLRRLVGHAATLRGAPADPAPAPLPTDHRSGSEESVGNASESAAATFAPAALLLCPTTTTLAPVATALLDDDFAAGTAGQREIGRAHV